MRLVLTRPLELRATVAVQRTGRADPTMRVDGRELWWATRTPEGPGTLHVQLDGDVVQAQAWGAGAAWLERQVPELLGEHDEPPTLAPTHPVVTEAHRRHPGLRVGRSGVVVPALVAAVLGQRVTGFESTRQWAALCRVLGDQAPGPGGLCLPPDPERLAGHPAWWFHRFGIEEHRAATLRRVGRHAGRLQEAATMAPAEAERRLRAVSGIGAWSSALVLGSSLGDPDAVPVGDVNLPNDVAWALAGEPRGDDDRMLELLAPYAGQRGRVLRLLGLEAGHAPRFGPRRRILPVSRW